MPRQLTCFSSLKATDRVVIFPIVDPSQSDDVAQYQALKREAVCQYGGADSPQLIFFPFYVDKELETTGLVTVYLPPGSKLEVVIVGPLSVSLANDMDRLFSRLFQENLKLSVNLDACRADVNLTSPSMEQLVVHLLAQFRALGPSDKFPPVLDSILAMSRIFATQVKQLIGDREKLLADKKMLAATTEERSEQADRLQTQVDSLTTALTALTQQLSQQQSILSAEQDRTRQATAFS